MILGRAVAFLGGANEHLHAACDVNHDEKHRESQRQYESIGVDASLCEWSKGEGWQERVSPADVVGIEGFDRVRSSTGCKYCRFQVARVVEFKLLTTKEEKKQDKLG